MSGRLKVAGAFDLDFAAAQLVRPERTNPPTETGRKILAHMRTANGLAAVLERSRRDGHSNATLCPRTGLSARDAETFSAAAR